MSDEMTGGCLCGAVRYRITARPKLQLACHCKNCQRVSGSAFSLSCLVPHEAFTLEGELKLYVGEADSGNKTRRWFCPTCGTGIYVEVAARPDAVALRAGTLDDASWFKPRVNLWTDSKQDWVPIDPKCKNFPRNVGD